MSALALLSRGGPLANRPTAELALAIPQRVVGDPLGLGAARPAAPADPDLYDGAREAREGSRSLLSAAELTALDAEIAAHGFYSPATVRGLIAENCARGQLESTGLDPELMLIIDARIDYKLFVAGDNVYVREELYANFPFHEFGVQPEAVFAAQEIGVFAPRIAGSATGGVTGSSIVTFDYAVRDAGDARIGFSPAEDLVKAACGGPPPRQPRQIVKTKIFVGREPWEDFKLHMRFYRGAVRMAAAGQRLEQIAHSTAEPYLPRAPSTAEPDLPRGASSSNGTAESDLPRAPSSNSTAESDLPRASSSNGTAESDLPRASSSNGTAESDLPRDRQVAALSRQVADLSQQVADLNQQVADLSRQMADLSRQMAELAPPSVKK